MLEHWERLAEAQRITQEIEVEFQLALSEIGREAAERVRRAARDRSADEVGPAFDYEPVPASPRMRRRSRICPAW